MSIMLIVFGIKDKIADGFLQITTAKSVPQLRRELTNVVNGPKEGRVSLFATNPEDFSLYRLGYVDEETGNITSEVKKEFDFSDLVKHAS